MEKQRKGFNQHLNLEQRELQGRRDNIVPISGVHSRSQRGRLETAFSD